MRTAAERAAHAFAERFGCPHDLLVHAPGRVNLLGDHTDYNQGFALPMAIDRHIAMAVRARDDARVELVSADFDEVRSFALPVSSHDHGWIEYVKGTAWALQEDGVALRGFEGVLSGDIPIGAGLSSSAALEIATATAFGALAGRPWDPVQAARQAQRAESGWVGVQCGIMDQLVVAAGREGHALLIDCRDLKTRPVAIPPGVVVVVLDTSTRRGLIASAYNDRRSRCDQASRILGTKSLREVEPRDLERLGASLPPSLRGLVRHVVAENARTLHGADALAGGDVAAFGRLMLESHISLRDDFNVSSASLDAMVDAACEQDGCHGARMTGAGFAGCAVALVDEKAVEGFVQAVPRAFQRSTGLTATAHACRPQGGASVAARGGA